MWFKNIQVYTLSGTEQHSEDKLEEMLAQSKFVPCNKHDLTKTGWVTIYEDDKEEKLTRKVKNAFFLKLRTESKVIPSSVVKERLKERIKEFLESNDGKKPSKDEKNDFKDAIILDMASTAFTQSSFIEAYVDYDNKYLVVNAGSSKKAEELIGYLRMSTGSLEVIPLEPEDDPADKMSTWVSGKSAPDNFEFGINCELKDLDGGAISVKKHELECDEVKNHLDNGKKVVKLEMIWQKRIRFSITEKFEIKSIKAEDIVAESVDEELGESDDFHSKFQSNMFIMVADFAEMIDELVENV